MTPQQQRIALAEWAGIKTTKANQPVYFCPTCKTNVDANHSLTHQTFVSFPHPPDYLSDLNAVHELENKLEIGVGGPVRKIDYIRFLMSCTIADPDVNVWRWCHATAAQRCEALLRTLNLWRDE